MIKRRPTRRRSSPRDNRWRGTLPEANILIRKLLGLSTSKFIRYGIRGLRPLPSNSWLRSFIICRSSIALALRATWPIII